MFKLILSNNKDIKKVFSNGVVVWEMKKLVRRETLLRTEELSAETLGDELIINRINDDWDYIEIDGIRINKTDGVFKKIFYTVFEITNRSKKDDIKRKMISSYHHFSVRQYKYVEEWVTPDPPQTNPAPSQTETERPSRTPFETKSVEVFNAGNSISISRIGRDWDSFEIAGVEVSQSDGTQYYNDFTINNNLKVQSVKLATKLGNYSIGNFVVRKFRGG